MSRKYVAQHDEKYDVIELHYAKQSIKDDAVWFVDPSPSVSWRTEQTPELLVGLLDELASLGDDGAEELLALANEVWAGRLGENEPA